MAIKLNDNNPRIITSAIYAFGAIVETVHVEKIETVIPDSIKSIANLFGKKNEELNLTLSWFKNYLPGPFKNNFRKY